jgi:hypothetical protein
MVGGEAAEQGSARSDPSKSKQQLAVFRNQQFNEGLLLINVQELEATSMPLSKNGTLV